MKCDKIRDFLITDYMDGQLSREAVKEIEEHLAGCDGCGAYKEMIINKGLTPPDAMKLMTPPEKVWGNIRSRIEEEQRQEKRNVPGEFMNKIRSIFYVPKPAYALAGVLVLLIVVSVFWGTHIRDEFMVQEYMEEQIDFYESLDNGNGFDLSENGFFNGV